MWEPDKCESHVTGGSEGQYKNEKGKQINTEMNNVVPWRSQESEKNRWNASQKGMVVLYFFQGREKQGLKLQHLYSAEVYWDIKIFVRC